MNEHECENCDIVIVGDEDRKLCFYCQMAADDKTAQAKTTAYEARISELEATVARVKAESLRVVADGGPVTAFRLDGNDKFIQVEGEVYYRSGETLICTNTRIYQGLDDDTIVQPVRLERWEDAE